MSRIVKVADFIRDELSLLLQNDMRDPRIPGFISINEVKVSKDLAFADIYISSLASQSPQEQDELVAVLNGAAGFFRSELARRHKMRTTPKPRFHYDSIVESGPKLERLINQAVAEDTAKRESNTDSLD